LGFLFTQVVQKHNLDGWENKVNFDCLLCR